ncbi:PorT family protein [Flavobacterium album]|uniref:PorT family protein n=1 Tax=Flavobacterium album TaxID=2175091 RepID=A0A2S1QTE9_9FLAO|nr:porin family protein [Flavobacterium album]AWH83663.1 PorT family protein [Flavobacterium album]
MRRLFLAAALLLCAPIMNAQTYGIKGGVNFANLTGNDADAFDGLTSFHIGALMEFNILDRITLQPELLYSVQGAKNDGEEYKLNYMTLPVMVEFDIDGSLSLHAGPQFSLLANETKHVAPKEANNYDFGLAAGLEYEITGGLFIQGRYVWGQRQVFEDADVKNSVIQFSLGFYF